MGNVCLLSSLLQMPFLCPVSEPSHDQAAPRLLSLLSLVAEAHARPSPEELVLVARVLGTSCSSLSPARALSSLGRRQ